MHIIDNIIINALTNRTLEIFLTFNVRQEKIEQQYGRLEKVLQSLMFDNYMQTNVYLISL